MIGETIKEAESDAKQPSEVPRWNPIRHGHMSLIPTPFRALCRQHPSRMWPLTTPPLARSTHSYRYWYVGEFTLGAGMTGSTLDVYSEVDALTGSASEHAAAAQGTPLKLLAPLLEPVFIERSLMPGW